MSDVMSQMLYVVDTVQNGVDNDSCVGWVKIYVNT